MKKINLILPFLFISSVCHAEEWDKIDYSLAAISTTALVVDWKQTQYSIRHQEQFHEQNGMIKGSIGKTNNYFGSIIIGNLLLANILPQEYRRIQLGGMAIFEINIAYKNYSVGITVPFK